MKRNATLLIFTILLSQHLFAQSFISEKGIKAINDFQAFRMELTEFQDNKLEAVKKLEDYQNNHSLEDLFEQEQLIMESFYIAELYNYIWEDKANDSMLQKAFLQQIEKNEKFISDHKNEVSDWMYMVTADSFSCYMSYNPVQGAMKYGIKLKKYYEKALEINPENSVCRTHYAQWFYWAPGVSGGSKKKSLANFKQAMDTAETVADKFYAYIFYSQIAFEQVSKEVAAEYLNKAKEIYPKSTYITELEYWNGRGYSLFGKDKKKAEEERNVSGNY